MFIFMTPSGAHSGELVSDSLYVVTPSCMTSRSNRKNIDFPCLSPVP
jgi:hypothetical protein